MKGRAPVRLADVVIGAVTEIALKGDNVEVSMEVRREKRSRITNTSVATLGSVSLLGEAAVDITASSSGEPILDWGYVRAEKKPGSIGDVAEQASEGLGEATA